MEERNLKIAFITFNSIEKMGGAQVFICNLADKLSLRGHQISFYVPRREYYSYKSFFHQARFSIMPLLFKSDRLVCYAPLFLRAYLYWQQLIHRYDIWQISGSYPGGYIATVLSGKVPLVLTTYGDDIQIDAALCYGLRLNPQLDKKIRKTILSMNALVAISKSVRDEYTVLGAQLEMIKEIPYGLDIKRFHKSLTDYSHVRAQLNMPVDKKLILTVGRNHLKKNYNIIPGVAQILKKRGLSFTWLIVGRDTSLLLSAIKEMGVEDVLEVREMISISTGPRKGNGNYQIPSDELLQLYHCADIFVFPSMLETFGLVLIEAMAAGLPVVTTDAPGCRDVIENGKYGLMVKRGDVEGFADQIEKLMNDAHLSANMVQAGLQYVKRFSWENIVSAYENLYLSLLK